MFTDIDRAEWKDAKSASTKLPDGKYKGHIKSSKFSVMRNDGSRKLLIEYLITYPTESFGSYTQFLGLEGKNQKYYTRLALFNLGLNADVELDGIVDEINRNTGKLIELELVTQGEYQNCTVKESKQEEDDDVPFG